MNDPLPEPLWVRALLSANLTAIEYRVWSYLFWRQGANDSAWPSQRAIADAMGLTVQGVRSITRRLARKSWLRVQPAGAVGRGHSVRYQVIAPAEKVNSGLPLKSTEKVNSGLPFAVEKVNGDTPKRSTAVDPNTIQRTLTEEEVLAGGLGDLPSGITFDRRLGHFIGLNGQPQVWQQIYSTIDVWAEIQKAEVWVMANPRKIKKNWQRFIVNWLGRAQREQQGGNRRYASRPSFAAQVSAVGERIEV